MPDPGEGHLFADDSAIELYAASCPPGPPNTWVLNEYGQPSWILVHESMQFGGWGVIIPPGPELEIPPKLRVARALDRRDQGLDTWGVSKTIRELRHVLATGPALMPTITWATPRPERRGHPGVGWSESELSCCAAWLSDIRGWSNPSIATHLFPDREIPQDDGTLRRKVRRYVRAGRQALCDQGVWPWISVPIDRIDEDPDDVEGDLPPYWWEDNDVLAHLEVWVELTRATTSVRQSEIQSMIGLAPDPPIPDAW